jgi:hypothetical protein
MWRAPPHAYLRKYLRKASAARRADPAGRSRAVSGGRPDLARFTPRELLLAAAAQAVLKAFREPREQRRLGTPAAATLRLLETALEPYGLDPLPGACNPGN